MEPQDARDRLQDERARLEVVRQTIDLRDLREESESESLSELSSNGQHEADLGTETFNRERDLSILESIELELVDVEHALKRIDEGTYGKCEACGKDIEDDRLAVIPAARFCLEDQTKAEHELRLSR
jgi:RNA polymerase-binding transcription factor DksA